MMKDYYYILGVNKNATKEEIVQAYRKLSQKIHPDHNSGDKFFEEHFKSVKEAYETLSNDYERGKYDAQFEADTKYSYQSTAPVQKSNSSYSGFTKPTQSSNNTNTHSNSSAPSYTFVEDDGSKAIRKRALRNLLLIAGITLLSYYVCSKLDAYSNARRGHVVQTGTAHTVVLCIILPVIYCGWKIVTYCIHFLMGGKVVIASVWLWFVYYIIKFGISLSVGFICLPFYLLLTIIALLYPTPFARLRFLRFLIKVI